MAVNLARKGRARPRLLDLSPHPSLIGAPCSILTLFVAVGSAFPLAKTWNSLKALHPSHPGALTIGESHV